MRVGESRSNETLLSQVGREVPVALKELHRIATLYTDPKTSRLNPQKVTHLLFLLSSPWVRVSSIRTLRFMRARPFMVTEELIERMFADEVKLQAREGAEEGFSPIERTIVGLRLNGYPVNTPPSAPVTVAEVTFFSASASDEVLESLHNSAEEVFPHLERSFHSIPLAAYHGMAAVSPSLLSYLFVNVTGEVTELLHVEDGAPVAFGTFPAGRNLLVRTLQSNTIPEHEALSAIRLSQKESSSFRSSLSETFVHTEREWRQSFREALSALVPTGAFPQTILLVADLQVEDWFAEVIRKEEFLTVSRGAPPAVRTLPPSELGAHLRFHSGVPDTLVFLTALFADARFDQRKTLDLLSTKIPIGIPLRATLRA